MTKMKQRLTEEEQKLLDMAKIRNSDLYKEQLQYQRNQKILKDKIRIMQLEREITFKQQEIVNKKSTEVHEGFIDRVKPLHYIESDIDQLNYEISVLKEGIQKMEEEQAKNVQ